MAEPYSPEQAEKERQREQNQLVLDIKALFNSERGQRVLAWMKRVTCFDRCEADSEAVPDNIIARRSAGKRIIYDIERIRQQPLRRAAKPKRAHAGAHHETPTAPPA